MEEKSIYPFNLVDTANEDIRKYGKEIQIVRNEDDGYYSIDILTIDDGGNTKGINTFAENLFESELADCVSDAWANVWERERIDSLNPENKEAPSHLYPLLHTRSVCLDMLETALLEFVRENGKECGEYEINEFGLNEGEDGEGTITKVWNFFDNGGCFFCESDGINSNSLEKMNEQNYYDKLFEGITHTAYLCLYIVEDSNGNETLKYYRFYNGGCTFDGDQAEPDHDYVSKLSLVDLSYIIEAIKQNPEQP